MARSKPKRTSIAIFNVDPACSILYHDHMRVKFVKIQFD